MSGIKWDEVPKNSRGFVSYKKIPSAAVRVIVAKAEYIKLNEELKAMEKRSEEYQDTNKMQRIRERLESIERLLESLKEIGHV